MGTYQPNQGVTQAILVSAVPFNAGQSSIQIAFFDSEGNPIDLSNPEDASSVLSALNEYVSFNDSNVNDLTDRIAALEAALA